MGWDLGPEPYELVPADAGHRGGLRPMPPIVVIMHATAGTDSLAWLTTTSTPPVSSHLLIRKDGHTYRLVPDNLEAWHAGYGYLGSYRPGAPLSLNDVSLGLELENLNTGQDPYPTVQLQAAAAAVARWMNLYGHMGVLSHATVDNRKVDPKGFPWGTWYNMLAQYLAHPDTIPRA